jgi:hypothetical protein
MEKNQKRGAGEGHEERHEKLAIRENCGCCPSYFHAAPRHLSSERVVVG